MSSPAMMADAFREQARVRRGAIARRFDGREVSYRDHDRASRVANGLIAAGCRPGARVAIIGKNSDSFLEVLGGALKARAVLARVNCRLAPPETAHVRSSNGTRLAVRKARTFAV